MKRLGLRFSLSLALVTASVPFAGEPAQLSPERQTGKTLASIDLTKAFGTRTTWIFVASQGPRVADYSYEGPAPGVVRLCLAKSALGRCDLPLEAMPVPPPPLSRNDWAPHYLKKASLVFPRGRLSPPLFLVQTGSLYSGDGDEAVFTQLLNYSRRQDRFTQVYKKEVGRNNEQEVRYIAAGPLKGSVISAEPAEHAPYGFWVTVSRPTPAYAYRQVLRYRSATGYGDGNPLAVIDSEMPNIERRLGLWDARTPLPLPAGPCAKPRLIHDELWCA